MIERRAFLKRAALGAGGLLGFSASQFAKGDENASPGRKANKPRITLAVETSMFRRHRPPDVFTVIRQAGYRFVELGGAHFRAAAITPQAVDRLAEGLKNAGLTPIGTFTVYPISSTDEAHRLEAIARWRRSIEAVGRLGVKQINTELTGDLTKPAECEAAFRKSMDVLLPRFEEADIHLSVEPHPGDFYESALPTIKLLRSYDSKYLGYLHCIPHTFYLSKSMPQVIREAGELLTHVHVADTFRTERIMARSGVGLHLHSTPGLGEVDFQETFDALAAIGYRGYASVQLLSHADTPADSARQAKDYLEKLLGEGLIT